MDMSSEEKSVGVGHHGVAKMKEVIRLGET
jgi:hypothetical protein